MFLLIYFTETVEVKPFKDVKEALAYTRRLMMYGEGLPYCVLRDKKGKIEVIIRPEYFIRVWRDKFNLERLMEIRNVYR